MAPGKKFIVGGDVRRSTPPFLAALVDGLLRAGMEVIDLGLLLTPMIYFAKRHLRADGCAIVTASHNPAAINELKWMLGDRPPTSENVAALERSVKKHVVEDGRIHGASRTVDIAADYVAWLQDTFKESSETRMRVVLDPMQGCWAGRAERYLQAVFPRCDFAVIHDTTDAQFGGRTPDCSRPHELQELCAAVCHEQAHLGIAFDGDGDRVALVDNQGVALSAEEATWVLLHSFGRQMHGSRFVYDLKFSDRIPEAAKRLAAEPLVERSGHAL